MKMKTPFSSRPALAGILCAGIFASVVPGRAESQPPIEIYLSEGMGRWGQYWFPALGGRKTHPTPRGKFTVVSKSAEFYSRKYKADMPLSVFFTDQCAIHVGSLRVSSHGCIHVDWQTGDYIYKYAEPGKTLVRVYE
jgi:hypothetical protein